MADRIDEALGAIEEYVEESEGPDGGAELVALCIATLRAEIARLREQAVSLEEAAERMDWTQVRLNYPSKPCFALLDDGRFCLRGEPWVGHGTDHAYTTLSAAIRAARDGKA